MTVSPADMLARQAYDLVGRGRLFNRKVRLRVWPSRRPGTGPGGTQERVRMAQGAGRRQGFGTWLACFMRDTGPCRQLRRCGTGT